MKRVAVCCVALLSLLALGPAAAAQTAVLDQAASRLRSDPVYVDARAERAVDAGAADRLRQAIRRSNSPIFLAVLPSSAAQEAGGDPGQVPGALAQRVGLAGTYGVVVGNSFRAGSNSLPAGRAGALATTAFQAHSTDGTEAVLADFVDRVAAESAGASGGGTVPSNGDNGETGNGSGGAGGVSLLPVVLVVAAVGVGLYLWQRGKQRTAAAESARSQADRGLLEAELSVLADDVLALEPQVALHPDARDDYEAGVMRYRVAKAALEHVGRPIDLDRVRRVVDEGRYAMSRARARIDGREPPPPPADLTRPGRSGEPAVDLDRRGRATYVGFGGPFYGGGWFGGAGGLLTGLFLGEMLGGWGWGGGWGWRGGYNETNVYVDQGDGGDGGDWGGGGDWGADTGGGDWGGGDFGGGDWGGGDTGGGDW